MRFAAFLLAVSCVAFALVGSASAQNSDDMNTADKDERAYTLIKQAQPLISDKKFVEARKLLKEAAALDPTSNSGNCHASLSYVDHQLGDLEGAIAESQLAMKFDPRFVDDLTWNVAMAYKDLGEYATAREWIQKYLDTNPTDPKRRREAEEFSRKLGEQAASNSSQSVHGPDYLDALVRQNGVGRWPRTSFPLKVFIEKSDNIPGVPADNVQMLMDAFDAWNKASGGIIPVQQVAKSKQADITIQWTNIPSKVSAHDGVHLEQGITRVLRYQTPGSMINTIKSATIVLLTVSRDTGEPLQPDELKAVCLHEIGHAFGLGGHSANSADTMYFSSSARQLPALSHRDKTTISKLYSVGQATRTSFGMSNMSSNYGATMPPFSQQSGSFSQSPGPFSQSPGAFSQQPGTSSQPPPFSMSPANSFQGGSGQLAPFQQPNQPYRSYPQPSCQAPYNGQPFRQPAYQLPYSPAQQSGYPQSYPPPQYPQQTYSQQPYPQQPYSQQPYPSQNFPQQAYPPQYYPPQQAVPFPQAMPQSVPFPQAGYPQRQQ